MHTKFWSENLKQSHDLEGHKWEDNIGFSLRQNKYL
jgi:hypothetical protein